MFHFANIFNSKFQNNYCFVQKLPLSINKKVQSPRFALQELLKQFLLLYRHHMRIFLTHKNVRSKKTCCGLNSITMTEWDVHENISCLCILFYLITRTFNTPSIAFNLSAISCVESESISNTQ